MPKQSQAIEKSQTSAATSHHYHRLSFPYRTYIIASSATVKWCQQPTDPCVEREREMCHRWSRRSYPPRGPDPPQDCWSSHPITSVGPSSLEPASMPSLSCSALMWYKWVLCLQRDLLFWFCSHPSHLLHLPHHLQIHSKVELKWVAGGLMWQWLDLTGVRGTVWPQEECKIHLV